MGFAVREGLPTIREQSCVGARIGEDKWLASTGLAAPPTGTSYSSSPLEPRPREARQSLNRTIVPLTTKPLSVSMKLTLLPSGLTTKS